MPFVPEVSKFNFDPLGVILAIRKKLTLEPLYINYNFLKFQVTKKCRELIIFKRSCGFKGIFFQFGGGGQQWPQLDHLGAVLNFRKKLFESLRHRENWPWANATLNFFLKFKVSKGFFLDFPDVLSFQTTFF